MVMSSSMVACFEQKMPSKVLNSTFCRVGWPTKPQITKKGPTCDPNNFCPMSLTAICCRVMERVINNELLRYLPDHHLITRKQHSFLKRKSVCMYLLKCLEDWTLNLQARHVTDVIYFDFQKAFDTVCHNKLLSKLKSYGICGSHLSSIEAFLCGRSQSVCIGEAISAAVLLLAVSLQEVCYAQHYFCYLLMM